VTDLRSALRERVDAELAAVVPPGAPVALIGFPNHSNPGDAAIWVGELAWLRRHGHRIDYACDWLSYDPGQLARAAPGATLLLHGGGNLGDVWPAHQALRERLIAAFPGHRIVQLPQTLAFSDPANLERARRVFDAHPDLHLLLRDHRSLEQARAAFACESRLCPDAAFALGPLDRLGEPTADVVWLARTDAEATGAPAAAPAGVRRVDWLSEKTGDPGWTGAEARLRLVSRGGGRVLKRTGAALAPAAPALWRLYDRQATSRLQYGRRLLSGGRAVVTDRLHGHILCVLMDIPHVALDNSYGKNRSFHEAWTLDWPSVRWAGSPADAEHALAYLISTAA